AFTRVESLTGSDAQDTLRFFGGNMDGVVDPGSDGQAVWEAGAGADALKWQINDVLGAAGDNPGWDYLFVNGSLSFTAAASGLISIDIGSLNRPVVPGPRPAGSTLNQTAGYVFNFDCREEYRWPILYAAGGINNF